MHMARRDTDKDGKCVVPKLGTLVQQCAAKIAGDEETFSNDLDLMGTFREQVQTRSKSLWIFASERRVPGWAVMITADHAFVWFETELFCVCQFGEDTGKKGGKKK